MKMNSHVRKVAEVIRREVPRPKELPTPVSIKTALRFTAGHTRSFRRCPMGLLPLAKDPQPLHCYEFADPGYGFMDEEVMQFANWWDAQRDPQAAMDAVWGTVTEGSGV